MPPDLSQGGEDVKIQNTVAVTPIEPLDEAVLHRFASLEEAGLDAMRLGPLSQRDRHELGAKGMGRSSPMRAVLVTAHLKVRRLRKSGLRARIRSVGGTSLASRFSLVRNTCHPHNPAMLEEIATKYVSQTDASLRLISYAITIAGASAAAIYHKSSAELRRAPYFAYSGLLFFITAASQLVWLSSIPAMTGGFLWVFVLVDVVVGLGIGYAFGVIAMARSRDAYGHARMAFLAFIPLANLWLLLTASKSKVSANRAPTIPLLTGAVGVLTGFVLVMAGIALGAFIQVETNRIVVEASNDPALQRAGVDMMLREEGIEETLRQMAADVPSQRIDESTTLLRVVGDGTTLRYVYEVSISSGALSISMRTGLVQHNCNYEGLRPLIEAGATVEHVYRHRDGSHIGVVTITRDKCEF